MNFNKEVYCDNLITLDEEEYKEDIDVQSFQKSFEVKVAEDMLHKLNKNSVIEPKSEEDTKVKELVNLFNSWKSEDFLYTQLLTRKILLQRDYELINELRTEYELDDGVINVLIHYTLEETKRLPRPYIIKVASSWVEGDITTTRLAVESLLRINKNKVRFTSVIKKASTDCQDLLCFLDDVTTNDSEMQSLLTIIKQHIESIMIDLKNGSSWEV